MIKDMKEREKSSTGSSKVIQHKLKLSTRIRRIAILTMNERKNLLQL